MRLALVALCISVLAGPCFAAFSPPARLVVVTDDNYPPFLFRGDDGRVQGILKDKWELWSARTGVEVVLQGMSWAVAQEAVRGGSAEVIEALAHTTARERDYEYGPAYASVEARVFVHRSISGISDDIGTMRGFTIGAKLGSACADWLVAGGLAADSVRAYATSDAVVQAARAGELRLFCMDVPVAQYLLFKHRVAGEYRQTPPLYAASFHWAVRNGETGLREFIQHGFERIERGELQAIEARWIGNPLTFPIETRYYYYAAASAAALLAAAGLLVAWNSSLRKRVLARTARLRELSRRLAEAEESERRNINRELHDRVGQNLSALQLHLGTLQHELAAAAPGVLGERLNDAQSLLASTSSQVRDVMAELRPPGLDEYGLLAALTHHCAAVSARLGVDISVTGRDAVPRLPAATETALFRIAQEALSNVAKHARARHVSVDLASGRRGMTLTVADDGVGFAAGVAAAVSPSYGLITMQERAEAADARLTIESAPGGGTRVVVRLDTA